ncbi:hypothetical protein AMS68_003143 [Peltaster fructicola]|uniref:non-specific serine/threonine protein kinase n=1 Tax=Peltaster fructicola TaxID=286661 RepID=A0A6H0XSH4_9PEZI|nr:hypothetical protein AMS68_003143 [Peltaster fructicola]
MSSAAVQQQSTPQQYLQNSSVSARHTRNGNDSFDTPSSASTVKHSLSDNMAQPSYDQYYTTQNTSLPIRTQQSPTTNPTSFDRQSASSRTQHDSTGYTSENERDRRQRTQRSSGDSPAQPGSGRSQRTRQAPQQSRSQTAIGMPPIGTDLPRENSAIINHIVVDDPSTDIERERARVAEAQPVAPGQDLAPVTGLGLVGDHGVPDADRAAVGQQRSRQEHLRGASHRKEVKFGDYILGQTLGEGEFGKVKMGWKKDGGVQVAIKLIRKESLAGNTTRLPKIYREISILKELEHPNIVRLHEFVETERHMGIILEYASGGELFDYILNHRYLKDPAARRLFAQLVSGVGYLHKKGIVHRDLKLENLLLDRYKNIIITDFGFANTFNPNDELGEDVEHRISDKDYIKREGLDAINKNGFRRGDLMQTSCGSPCYAAPELVVSDGLYTGRKVDVWSCGVILYAMLAGYLPFDDDPANPEGDNINLLYKYIVSTPLTFPEYVTPHARDLLRRILVPDPRRRADLFEVARHSWLSEYGHLVGFIGSSSKSDRDIAKSAMRQEDTQVLGRSASVREPSTRSPVVPLLRNLLRPTPKTHAVEQAILRGGLCKLTQTPIAGIGRTRARPDSQGPIEVSPLVPRKEVGSQPMAPPAARAHTRQDSTVGAQPAIASRPNTRGNLPSRGNSYSTPVVATPTTENAQGRFSQPKPSPGYIGTISQSPVSPIAAESRPGSHQAFTQFAPVAQQMPHSGGHKRSSTLGSITDRVLGRSNSRRKAQAQEAQNANEKRDRRYPPVSMNNAMANVQQNEDAAPRKSTESRRSSFQFLRKNSEVPTDREQKRSSRRFSFLPSNFSMGNLTGKNASTDGEQPNKRASISQRIGRPSSKGMAFGRGSSRSPSQSTLNSNIPQPQAYEDRGNKPRSGTLDKALPPGVQRKQFRDDGYGGNLLEHNGIQDQQSSLQPQSRNEPVERFYTPAQDYESMMASNNARPDEHDHYRGADDGYGAAAVDQSTSNVQIIRPQQRKFDDAYERGHDGSSSGARRVMDFFRRRGKERGVKD